jgi:hypothetical protein
MAVRLVLRRSPPMFPPAIWNVHDATVNGDARTNNMCEGWNNKLFNLVGHDHLSIWRVIEWCQKEEASKLNQSNLGAQLSLMGHQV